MITHRPVPTRALAVTGAAALLLVTIAAGCSHRYSTDDTATGAASELLGARPGDIGMDFSRSRSLYPLAVGNYWEYRVRGQIQIIAPSALPPVVGESPYFIYITGTRTVDGRDYFLQLQGDPRMGRADVPVPVRSSRFGLFQLVSNQAVRAAAPVDPAAAELSAYVDRAITDPAKRAAYQRAAAELAAKLSGIRAMPGGVELGTPSEPAPDELTLLSYPIYPGARWVVRADPHFARVVEGAERINTPLGTFVAWRIRGTSELFGPNDRVHYWYSRLGLLRFRYHVEVDAADSTGAVIGRAAIDSDQSLTRIQLVKGGAALVTGGDAAE